MLFKVSSPKECTMDRVLLVPKLACNLFSVRAAVAKDNFVKFSKLKCWIQGPNGSLLGMGTLEDKLYRLECNAIVEEQASVATSTGVNINIWHQRLGHVSEQRLREMVTTDAVRGVNIPQKSRLSFCEGCVEGKMCRKPFKPVGEIQATRRLQRVHSDVCGPLSTESIGGRRYFVTFTDDFSRCSRVYFMRNKTEVLEKFKLFEAVTTNDCGLKIGALRTDNGGEYVSNTICSKEASSMN